MSKEKINNSATNGFSQIQFQLAILKQQLKILAFCSLSIDKYKNISNRNFVEESILYFITSSVSEFNSC